MRKIHDVLGLSAAGMSKRKIAASLGVSATAPGSACDGRGGQGLTWPLPPPPTAAATDRRPRPNWAVVHRELRRPGVTLQLLWEEHRAVHPWRQPFLRAPSRLGGATVAEPCGRAMSPASVCEPIQSDRPCVQVASA